MFGGAIFVSLRQVKFVSCFVWKLISWHPLECNFAPYTMERSESNLKFKNVAFMQKYLLGKVICWPSSSSPGMDRGHGGIERLLYSSPDVEKCQKTIILPGLDWHF